MTNVCIEDTKIAQLLKEEDIRFRATVENRQLEEGVKDECVFDTSFEQEVSFA